MNNIIKEYNKWLLKQDIFGMSNGLLSGRLGLCLYWYQQSRMYSNRNYEKKADQILEEVLRHIGSSTGVGFEDGLVGILLGINYLVKDKYINVNIKTVFSDANDKLFQYGYFRGIDPVVDENVDIRHLIWICIYYCQLIKDRNVSKENEYLIKRFVIESINTIEEKLRGNHFSLMSEDCFKPFSYMPALLLCLIGKMYQLNLYTYKLNMFCFELSKKIVSNIPVNYGYRYMLYVYIEQLTHVIGNLPDGFYETKRMLSSLIAKKSILHEFRRFDLDLRQGFSGLLFFILNNTNDPSLLGDFEKKIKNYVRNSPSDVWMNNKVYNCGDSITGVIYMYQRLKMYYEKNRFN